MQRLGLRVAAGASSHVTRRAPGIAHRVLSRSLHHRQELPYDVEKGLGDFLPPPALKMIAEDYQQGLLDRLNEQVRDTEQARKSVAQTVVDAAMDPNKALAFGYASEALNNSFFLSCLRPPPEDGSSYEDKMSNQLVHQIRIDFGSMEQLKSTFSATALGMLSTGWVWLVCDQHGSLAVHPTFGTGTLLVRSRMPTRPDESMVLGESMGGPSELTQKSPQPASASPVPPTSPTSGTTHPPRDMHPPTQFRTFSSSAAARYGFSNSSPASLHENRESSSSVDSAKLGEYLFPLLCVSVHEHAWVGAGYGVWGKEEYLKRFWSVVHWQSVSQAYKDFSQYKGRVLESLSR